MTETSGQTAVPMDDVPFPLVPRTRRYGPVDAAVLRQLRAIVGHGQVLSEPGEVEPYARDATALF